MKMLAEPIGGKRDAYHRRLAFTLIEMLVVVAIILILSGITLKIMQMVNRKTGTAATLRVLEQVKNALGAYYTTYGIYPPVDFVQYEYEGTPLASMPSAPADPGYRTGLVYYIYSGDHHNPDTEASRWQHYLEGIGGTGSKVKTNSGGGAFNFNFTNRLHSIYDAWGQELHYECTSNSSYQSYKLWSDGPTTNTADDLGVTSQD